MTEGKTDLNTATAEELRQLPGIGPTLAERIITYRSTVEGFQEPAEITAVPGIGERTYEAIDDRLTVVSPEEARARAYEMSTEEVGESEGPSEEGVVEEHAVAKDEAVSETDLDLVGLASEGHGPEGWGIPEEAIEETSPENAETRQEAIEEALPEGAETSEEETEEASPERAATLDEALEESSPEGGETAEAFGKTSPGIEETPAEAATPIEEEPTEETPRAEPDRPLPALEAAPEPARRPSFWSRLSWLWTAILGGFLGMVFALVVFAGFNGSIDVARSRAILDIEARMESLVADVDSLEGAVDGLRQRVNALEGLAGRIDGLESAVEGLQEETTDLSARADGLEQDIATVSEELQAVADDVGTLQEQAERTESFFLRLQALLNDIFGEAEGQPTSENE